MRRTRRFRSFTLQALLLGALIGAASLVAAFALLGSPGRSPLAGALFAVGGTALFGCGMAFVFDAVDAARHHRLASGKGVIVRWTVDERRWADFCRLNDEINAQSADRHFPISDARGPRPDGVEVVVGEDSLLLDGCLQTLPRGGLPVINGVCWHDGPPAFVEFSLEYSDGELGTTTGAVRLPTAEGQEAAARMALDHYSRRLASRPVKKA